MNREQLVLIGAVLLLVGCSRGGDGNATETTPTTTAFSVAANEGTIVVEVGEDHTRLRYEDHTGGGELRFGDGEDLTVEAGPSQFEVTQGEPPGWPDGFPVPPRSEVASGSVLRVEPDVYLSTTYLSELTAQQVALFYARELAGLDPIVTPPETSATARVFTISFDGELAGFIVVRRSEDATEVGVQLLESR